MTILSKSIRILPLAAALALASGCKKEEKPATAEPAAEEPAAEEPAAEEPAAEEAAADEAAADEAADTEDYIRIEAMHAPAKPEDPVVVSFPSFKVTKAEFDPANLEGGTAEIEVELATLDSGVPKRDAHLQSADYLDVEKNPVAKITVKDVKKKDDTTYTANAVVNVHGVEQTWPVEFSVVETAEDSVTVEAEHSFKRTDFKIGKDKDDPTADELTLELRLTVPKTA